MTTATPDRTVTPLYDQALEGLMEGEVVCDAWDDCHAPATHVLHHGAACNSPTCAWHVAKWRAYIAAESPFTMLACHRCGARRIPIAQFDHRPI